MLRSMAFFCALIPSNRYHSHAMIQESATTSVSPLKPANAPGNRLGRTAIFVMIAGIITSTLMLLIVFNFGGDSSRAGNVDLLPVIAMALVIGGVCYCWSLVLAVRAWIAGEGATLLIWVVNLATLPPAALGLWSWFSSSELELRKWSFSLALPVILPFIALACISGTIVLRPLFRWFERRRKRVVPADCTRRQSVNWIKYAFLCYSLLLGFVILPVALCINSQFDRVLNPTIEGLVSYPHQGTWSTPYLEYVNDSADKFLSFKLNSECRDARQALLESGDLSFDRLAKLSQDSQQWVAKSAFNGLYASHRGRLPEIAYAMIVSPQNFPTNINFTAAHGVVIKEGSFEQRRLLLKSILNGTAIAPDLILYNFRESPVDVRLIPLLKEIFVTLNFDLEAFNTLVMWLPNDETLALLEDTWKSNDLDNQAMVQNLLNRDERRIRLLALRVFMDHAELLARPNVLHTLAAENQFARMKIRFVSFLRHLLNDNDLTVRRAAATLLVKKLELSDRLLQSVMSARVPDNPNVKSSNRFGFTQFTPASSASAQELKALQLIQNETDAWSRKHSDEDLEK